MIHLWTDADDKLNGTSWSTLDAMLEAVRAEYGEACDFAVIDGAILDGAGELVATYGSKS